MKLSRFEIFRYDLPLVSSISMNNIEIDVRSGLIIRLRDECNHSGYGEIAPLPGLHQENFNDALQNVQEVRLVLLNSEIPEGLERLAGGFDNWLSGNEILPSARFGLETAILNLIADANSQPLGSLLSENWQRTIEINGLLFGEGDEVIRQAELLIQDGYRTIKLKVGRKSVSEEIQNVDVLKKILKEGVQLRLDANRRWSSSDALQFSQAIGPEDIEYIEEPVADPSEFDAFYDQTGIPIALDESLNEISTERIKNITGLKAFIIKPSIIGGFERSMKFIRYGKIHNIYSVISSAFESSLGLSTLATFAASLNPGNIAMGLDTYRFFKDDLLQGKIKTTRGEIDAQTVYHQSSEIRQELLKEIS